ncbi:MAG: DUF2164 domain-containing protein [Candidatus Humimicrobiaceae bacterium]
MIKTELSKEEKKKAIQDIKEYFLRERNEEIGDLAGAMIFDFISEKMGPYFYNKAIIDVQKYMNEKVDDLFSLMK